MTTMIEQELMRRREDVARLTAERDALREALEEATDLAEGHGWAPAQRVHWRKTLNSTDGETRR